MDYELELWSLANGITAFSVLQAVAGMYVLAKGEIPVRLARNRRFRTALLSAAGLCTLAYCWAVWECARLALSLPVAKPQIWESVTIGRMVAIVFFQAMAAGGFWIVTTEERTSTPEGTLPKRKRRGA